MSAAPPTPPPQQQEDRLRRPVLVVGAGPVGLTAAAFLTRLGVPLRIIDARAAPTQLSKALVVWRRSVQTFDTLLPYEQLLAQAHGVAFAGVNFSENGAVFASIRDTPAPLQPAAGAAAPPPAQQLQQHALPAGLMMSQADVEAALTRLLQERYGVVVERATQLLSFCDEGGGVRCRLGPSPPGYDEQVARRVLGSSEPTPHEQPEDDAACAAGAGAGAAAAGGVERQQPPPTSGRPGGEGAAEELVASFLVGCDGARSTVRRGLGVPFPGVTEAGRRFFLADVAYEHEPGINPSTPRSNVEARPHPGSLLVNTSPQGLIGTIPIGDQQGVVRLVLWDAGVEDAVEPTLDACQALLLRHTRMQVRLTKMLWVSAFALNERQVERYLHGHVLLAGDAAHVHSPAGGQGMNTGLQDAAALAWRLACALAPGGMAADAQQQLLESYQQERHPVGAAVIRASGTLLRAQTIRRPLLRALRRLAIGGLLSLPLVSGLVQRRMVAFLAQDSIEYPCSSVLAPAGGRRPVRAFPDTTISIAGQPRPATDLLRGAAIGSCGVLVVFVKTAAAAAVDDDAAAAEAGGGWPDTWAGRPLHVVRVAEAGAAASGGAAQDAWGLLDAAVFAGGGGSGGAPRGVLVRPDSYVAEAGSPRQLRAWLEQHGFA